MPTKTLTMLVMLCAGCAPATRSTEEARTVDSTKSALGEEPVALRQLMQESYTGLPDSLRTALRDATARADLWRHAYATRSAAPVLPAVDFDREMVVVAALGRRTSGGFAIYLDSARVHSGALEIFVRSVSPGPTCFTTAALTEPVAAAAVPRSLLPVRFVEQHATQGCS
jgi:hypothetical protein